MAKRKAAEPLDAEPTEKDAAAAALHPRATLSFYGHSAAEEVFLRAYNSGALHHAWLLTGERGIGKATFAYRAARFLLSRGSKQDGGREQAQSLSLPADHPTVRQIGARAHSSLFVLGNAGGAASSTSNIGVDEVRELRGFLALTSPSGWRAMIVDAANDLTISSGNALLKAIEEPPPRTVFFLVSQGASAVMPTIRSRCVRLSLRPLDEPDLRDAILNACERSAIPVPDETTLARLCASSLGSPGRALSLLGGGLMAVADKVSTLFARLPRTDQAQASELIQSVLGAKNSENFARLCDLVEEGIVAKAKEEARAGSRAAIKSGAWADLWQRVRERRIETETLNLDKGAFLISVFSDIEHTARDSTQALPA
jgi:DNA polymerase-3 subunit delta'